MAEPVRARQLIDEEGACSRLRGWPRWTLGGAGAIGPLGARLYSHVTLAEQGAPA
jgi:hypothetical protein